MYQNTKEQLHHSFDSLAPNLLSEILSADIHLVESEEELFSELMEHKTSSYKRSRHWTYQFASVAAIFICIISLFFFQTQTVEGTVTVKCKHVTTLALNHSGKIIQIDSDDPSESMLELMKDLKGKQLKEGLPKILKASKPDNKSVCIVYSGKKTDENREVIRDVSKRFSKDSGTDVVSKEQSVGHTKEETDMANDSDETKEETDVANHPDETKEETDVADHQAEMKEESSESLVASEDIELVDTPILATEEGIASDEEQASEKEDASIEEDSNRQLSEKSEMDDSMEGRIDSVESEEHIEQKTDEEDNAAAPVENKEEITSEEDRFLQE